MKRSKETSKLRLNHHSPVVIIDTLMDFNVLRLVCIFSNWKRVCFHDSGIIALPRGFSAVHGNAFIAMRLF